MRHQEEPWLVPLSPFTRLPPCTHRRGSQSPWPRAPCALLHQPATTLLSVPCLVARLHARRRPRLVPSSFSRFSWTPCHGRVAKRGPSPALGLLPEFLPPSSMVPLPRPSSPLDQELVNSCACPSLLCFAFSSEIASLLSSSPPARDPPSASPWFARTSSVRQGRCPAAFSCRDQDPPPRASGHLATPSPVLCPRPHNTVSAASTHLR